MDHERQRQQVTDVFDRLLPLLRETAKPFGARFSLHHVDEAVSRAALSLLRHVQREARKDNPDFARFAAPDYLYRTLQNALITDWRRQRRHERPQDLRIDQLARPDSVADLATEAADDAATRRGPVSLPLRAILDGLLDRGRRGSERVALSERAVRAALAYAGLDDVSPADLARRSGVHPSTIGADRLRVQEQVALTWYAIAVLANDPLETVDAARIDDTLNRLEELVASRGRLLTPRLFDRLGVAAVAVRPDRDGWLRVDRDRFRDAAQDCSNSRPTAWARAARADFEAVLTDFHEMEAGVAAALQDVPRTRVRYRCCLPACSLHVPGPRGV